MITLITILATLIGATTLDPIQPPSEHHTKIAAAIIARNEEKRSEDCLRSLAWADEIVVLDSFSDDQTVEISRRYTDKVHQRKFDNFSKQRNHALDLIESPWVLFVDADERVTPDLADEVRAVVDFY
jgi:glycosyltransferase involved in cell wall biosynthesis